MPHMSGEAWYAHHPKETRARGGIGAHPGMGREHGHTAGGVMTTEYHIWCGMKQRCHNPNDHGYSNYGGRGIKVAEEWRGDFAAFLAHVGLRPGPGYTLDRIDNDGNYEPGNVRWATWSQQRANKRPSKPYKTRRDKGISRRREVYA